MVWGDGITEAEFDLTKWHEMNKTLAGGWFYLLITDANGKYAVTKTYTTEDLD